MEPTIEEIEEVEDGETLHVIPLDDFLDHDIEDETLKCWCDPERNKGCPRVIIHRRAKNFPQ